MTATIELTEASSQRLSLVASDFKRSFLAAVLQMTMADYALWQLTPNPFGADVAVTLVWTRPSLALRMSGFIARAQARAQIKTQMNRLGATAP
jgi:hypothetical protein